MTTTADLPEAGHDAEARLEARLASPLLRLSPDAALDQWRRTLIEVRCHRPRMLEDEPGLAGRIRGAWGHRLRIAAEDSCDARGDPWRRPSAIDVLFEGHGSAPFVAQLPAPYVIGTRVTAEHVEIEMTLFGFAGFWAAAATDALLAALAGGITLRAGGRQQAVLEPLAAGVRRVESVSRLSPGREAHLIFRSPVRVRVDRRMRTDAQAILKGIVRRVRGIARWQDAEIETDWPMLEKSMDSLSIDDRELRPVAWERHSSRQNYRRIPMEGMTGLLVVRGELSGLVPFLALGETCHAGSHAAIGLGRYELFVFPF